MQGCLVLLIEKYSVLFIEGYVADIVLGHTIVVIILVVAMFTKPAEQY